MKKVTIVISLVEECGNLDDSDIEKEIERELSENVSMIPWAKKIERITVE
jgi:hypothetical protein